MSSKMTDGPVITLAFWLIALLAIHSLGEPASISCRADQITGMAAPAASPGDAPAARHC